MRPQWRCFVDTGYWYALVQSTDALHEHARLWAAAMHRPRLWTTDYVLLEVFNGLAKANARHKAVRLYAQLKSDPDMIIVAQDCALFERGREMYAGRPDKNWSLTDCLSFTVMTDLGLIDALTPDHHFEQAGFRALLRLPPPGTNGS